MGRTQVLFRWLPAALAVTLIGVAFWVGFQTTRGLAFPGMGWSGVGIDLYRDISSAQTMIDAGYGADPTYRGEKTWYNPLTPAISAAVSVLSGRPVHSVVTQIGAFANVLAPIAFFLMCAALFDAWTALFATAGFLFLMPGMLPSWISATYSPWFLPVNFVQALFYVTVIALHRAYRVRSLGAFVFAGVAWGVTFLGHTGPALVLGGMTVIWAAWTMWLARRRLGAGTGAVGADAGAGAAARMAPRDIAVRFAVMTGLAIVISLPFLAIIAGHYGLRIKNPDPSSYSEPLLSWQLATLIKLHITVPMAIAIVGLVALLRRRSHGVTRLIVFSWMLSAGAFLAYSFARLAAKSATGVMLPSIVPSFHFFFYLKAASAVLFGVGIMAIGRAWAARLTARRAPASKSPSPKGKNKPLSPSASRASQGARLARASLAMSARVRAAAIVLVLLGVQLPAWQGRPDFGAARAEALRIADSPQVRVFNWLRSHATQADVVLSSDEDAATVVAPAGAKAVAIFTGFSNPYVDLEPKRIARDSMLAALDHHESATFRDLARREHVTLVLAESPRAEAFDAQTPSDLELVFRAGNRRLYRVRQNVTP